jgi:hypothetical protein
VVPAMASRLSTSRRRVAWGWSAAAAVAMARSSRARVAGAGRGIGKVGADLDAKCVLKARTDCRLCEFLWTSLYG